MQNQFHHNYHPQLPNDYIGQDRFPRPAELAPEPFQLYYQPQRHQHHAIQDDPQRKLMVTNIVFATLSMVLSFQYYWSFYYFGFVPNLIGLYLSIYVYIYHGYSVQEKIQAQQAGGGLLAFKIFMVIELVLIFFATGLCIYLY